jgi:cardiolipin synthase
LNDESNLNVFSAEFAAEQVRIFEEDKKKSRQVTYEDWNNRSLWKRVMETLTAPFRAQL